MASTKDSTIALTRLVLFTLFNEPDASARLSTIKENWVPSGDCLFIDANGVYKTHESINNMVTGLQGLIGEQELAEIGEYTVLAQDAESDTWVAKVRWGIGPKGGEETMTGVDVVTIVGAKVKSVYTFIDGQ